MYYIFYILCSHKKLYIRPAKCKTKVVCRYYAILAICKLSTDVLASEYGEAHVDKRFTSLSFTLQC